MQAILSATCTAGNFIFQGVETIADRIKHVRSLARLPQEKFGRRLGVTRGAVGNWELGKGIEAENIVKIVEEFGVPIEWMMLNKGEAPRELGQQIDHASPTLIPEAIPQRGADFPVYASAEGGPGQIIRSADPVDWVPRPMQLANVKGAYGLLVTGESMEPEFRAGQTALVDPSLPHIGGEVYIFYTELDGEARATIKYLRGYSADQWRVSQWNPPEGMKSDFNLARREWRIAHRVIGKYSRR
jgi:phage repressor protein C with HTH and peptisase S24 domain